VDQQPGAPFGSLITVDRLISTTPGWLTDIVYSASFERQLARNLTLGSPSPQSNVAVVCAGDCRDKQSLQVHVRLKQLRNLNSITLAVASVLQDWLAYDTQSFSRGQELATFSAVKSSSVHSARCNSTPESEQPCAIWHCL